MRTLTFSLALGLAMVLETSLHLASGPDWFAMVLVLVLWQWEGSPAVVLAAMVGFVADCVTSIQFGVQVFWAVIVVSAGLNWIRREPSLLRTTALAFVVTAIWRFGCSASDGLLSRQPDWPRVATASILAAAWTATFVLVGGMFSRVMRSSQRQETAWRV